MNTLSVSLNRPAGPVCLSHNRLKMCSSGANGMADKETIAFLQKRKQEAGIHGHYHSVQWQDKVVPSLHAEHVSRMEQCAIFECVHDDATGMGSASPSSHLEGRLHSGDLEQAEFGQSGRLLLLFPNGGVAGRYHGVGVAMDVRVWALDTNVQASESEVRKPVLSHVFHNYSSI